MEPAPQGAMVRGRGQDIEGVSAAAVHHTLPGMPLHLGCDLGDDTIWGGDKDEVRDISDCLGGIVGPAPINHAGQSICGRASAAGYCCHAVASSSQPDCEGGSYGPSTYETYVWHFSPGPNKKAFSAWPRRLSESFTLFTVSVVADPSDLVVKLSKIAGAHRQFGRWHFQHTRRPARLSS